MTPRTGTVLAMAVASALAGCSIKDGEYFGDVPRPDPTHFRWCNSGEPEYIDPVMASSTTDIKIIYAAFDGLTVHDPDGLPEPSLATSWEVSPDQTRFVFHLRDDAHWSNGRRIVAGDFVYSMTRVLHPLTASVNAEVLWKVRNGQLYSAGLAKLLVRDVGGLRAGAVVEVLPEKKPGKDKQTGAPIEVDVAPPDSNLRRARAGASLLADPVAGAEVWAKLAADSELTIVELGGPARDWAYAHSADGNSGDGIYGWIPLADTSEPYADYEYRVKPVGGEAAVAVRGRDILMLPELLGISAPNDRTLVIETVGPTPYLVDLTMQRGFRPTPREAVGRNPRRWTKPEHIITSGPFHVTFWRQRDRFELIKSPTYWNKARVRLERVTIYSMNDQAANASYYYQGGCDATVSNNMPASWFPVLSGENGKPARKDYHRAAFLGIYYYIINVQRYPNVHLRRALSHALDRRMLPMIIKGGQIPTEQFTPGEPFAEMTDAELALCGQARDTPGVGMIVVKNELCYVPPMGPRFDLELAKQELELARREMGELPKKITIKFNTGVEFHKHIAEWIQHEWKKHLGIDVELESQEWKTFLKATRPPNWEYEVARMGGIMNFPDPEAELLNNFKCKSPDNRPAWCNAEFDRLFEEAEKAGDRKQRLELIRRAEQLIADEVPIIPLYVYTQHHLQRPYVKGLAINLVDQPNLRDVWIDPDWQKHAAEAAK